MFAFGCCALAATVLAGFVLMDGQGTSVEPETAERGEAAGEPGASPQLVLTGRPPAEPNCTSHVSGDSETEPRIPDPAANPVRRAFHAFKRQAWQEGIEALRDAVATLENLSYREQMRVRLVVALMEHGSAAEALEAMLDLLADGARFAQLPEEQDWLRVRSLLVNQTKYSEAGARRSLGQRVQSYFGMLGVRGFGPAGMDVFLTDRVKKRIVGRIDGQPAAVMETARALQRFLEVNVRIGLIVNEPDMPKIKEEVTGFVETYGKVKDVRIQAFCSYFRRFFPEFWDPALIDPGHR